jgi:hypothetical protein
MKTAATNRCAYTRTAELVLISRCDLLKKSATSLLGRPNQDNTEIAGFQNCRIAEREGGIAERKEG